MAAATAVNLTEFARDVRDGLARQGQKSISPRYFYDELGSTLFEAITLLPEYGLTRADERVLKLHARDVATLTGVVESVAELGSGSGRKTRYVLQAYGRGIAYSPIDISPAALAFCENQLSDIATVKTVCGDWMDGLRRITAGRRGSRPLLLLFLGSSVGNMLREDLPGFFSQIHNTLLPGDFFLLGADLVKDVDTMLSAYDDEIGVTAAFNLNLLSRINRELDADFDLRSFQHQVRWNPGQRRVEMHLRSRRRQTISVRGLNCSIDFLPGETIWTESSHKFTVDELAHFASAAGFESKRTWVDPEWPFAETLWRRL